MGSIHDYEQGERIGTGGFADVYRAVHVPSRHQVALKVSREDDESLARIRREIDVQRKLAHANVMQILDWDHEGFRWFVTEVAEGNLGQVDERKKLSEAEVVRLMEELLAGLATAHRRGFVHRDLSPGNILRIQGQWVLADWGYVTDPAASNVGRLTRTGTAGGTFAWAAPETLLDAHRADARSDLYALGKLAAWVLTGKAPGVGAAPELPESPHWRAYLGRLTEADAADRFQNAEEALAAIGPVVAALPASSDEREAGVDAVKVAAEISVVETLKRYLVAPEHRIRLFDMTTRITEETIQRISVDRFGSAHLDQGEAFLGRLSDYVECCRPLMHLLFTGCHFGDESQQDAWVTCVQRIADTYKAAGGYTIMNHTQLVPALLAMNAAAFGAMLGKRYRAFVAVTTRPILRHDNRATPLFAAVSTSTTINRDMLRATKRFARQTTPASELMFDYLRAHGRPVLTSDAEYQDQFDRFEIVTCLQAIDAGEFATGCFAWRDGRMAATRDYGLIARVRKEFEAEGAAWWLVAAGLFGGEPQRATTAFEKLAKTADRVAWEVG